MFSLPLSLSVSPPSISLKCSITNYNNRKFSMRHIEKECHIWYEGGREEGGMNRGEV